MPTVTTSVFNLKSKLAEYHQQLTSLTSSYDHLLEAFNELVDTIDHTPEVVNLTIQSTGTSFGKTFLDTIVKYNSTIDEIEQKKQPNPPRNPSSDSEPESDDDDDDIILCTPPMRRTASVIIPNAPERKRKHESKIDLASKEPRVI
jgi:hypothetical protein